MINFIKFLKQKKNGEDKIKQMKLQAKKTLKIIPLKLQ